MRKLRADAALLNLPEDQQAKLADWLLSGIPYHEARARVEKEFGVSPTRLVAFTSFWRRVCVPQLLQRRRRAPTAASSGIPTAPGRMSPCPAPPRARQSSVTPTKGH